jgi:glycosyltransferase involved in cell wall biosynthesis
MKILIDLTSLADNFSGIERFASCISYEMLMQNRNDFFILIFKEKIYPSFEKFIPARNVKMVVLPRCNKLLFNQVRLPVSIYKEDADVYFFPAFPAPFFFFNKNAVSAIHDLGCWDCPSSNKKYMTLYFKIMYWKASYGKKRVVTVSEFSRQRISAILKKDKTQIVVIYNGVSECFEQFNYSEKENMKAVELYNLPQNYILSLSTLEPRKNIRLLIDAYEELLSERKLDIDLVLAGRKGWLVDNLLRDISVETLKRIHFTGYVEDNLLPYVYRNAKMFVFPSVYEGFGVPPIEAMAMGVPVISSNAASLPEVLGDSAITFQSNDKNQLKQSILDVLQFNDCETEALKIKGDACVKKYNWKFEAKKLHKYLCNEFSGETNE